jgi:hypothetical protein
MDRYVLIERHDPGWVATMYGGKIVEARAFGDSPPLAAETLGGVSNVDFNKWYYSLSDGRIRLDEPPKPE